jgi:hypothetical protein
MPSKCPNPLYSLEIFPARGPRSRRFIKCRDDDLLPRKAFDGLAQAGRWQRMLFAASASTGTITPASSASLINREAVALFFGEIPNRWCNDVLVKYSRLTYFRQACR